MAVSPAVELTWCRLLFSNTAVLAATQHVMSASLLLITCCVSASIAPLAEAGPLMVKRKLSAQM